MEPLDPDFEYPHHRQVLEQLKRRLAAWTLDDEKKFSLRFTRSQLLEIVQDLEGQVNYYEANQESIILPDLSHLVQIPLDEDVFLLLYHYKLLRQLILHRRLSASEILMELLDKYEKSQDSE